MAKLKKNELVCPNPKREIGKENFDMNLLRNLLVSTLAFFTLAGCSSEREAQVPPEGSPAPAATATRTQTVQQYTRLDITGITVEGRQVKVAGATDLPEGSVLSVTFDVAGRAPKDTYIGVDANVNVQGGKFSADLEIPKRPEFAKGAYIAEVMFTPKAQTESVLALVGNDGEHLGGSKTKNSEFGFKTMEVSQKINSRINIASYPMVNPAAYSYGQPERIVAEFLSAWKRRNWSKMASHTQQSWRDGESNPAKTLENWFGIKDLMGAEVTNKSGSGVVSDITFKVHYAVGSTVETHTITARVICEDESGNPNPQGKWGINPSSALREE